MKCIWRPDFQSSEARTIQLRNAAVVFIDHTTWIVNSRENLQRILNEAREFYIANDSQINSNKSVLLVINKKKDELTTVQAGLNREMVTMLNNGEFARFLGIWIGSKDHKKETIARVKQDIDQIV